jgi:hypothetical protein
MATVIGGLTVDLKLNSAGYPRYCRNGAARGALTRD